MPYFFYFEVIISYHKLYKINIQRAWSTCGDNRRAFQDDDMFDLCNIPVTIKSKHVKNSPHTISDCNQSEVNKNQAPTGNQIIQTFFSVSVSTRFY